MMRRLLGVAVAAVLAVGLSVVPSQHADAIDQLGASLSPTGNLAVQDLRECLSSNPAGALDVYYLIDASGSLFGADGTDPSFARAEILQNSLVQLAQLSTSFSVQYAAGFFGTTFVQPTGWHSVATDETGGALKREIKEQKDGLGWTDWQLGIESAQSALAAQKKVSEGCQMIIWLTDGGINLGDDKPLATDSAINTLCGAQVQEKGSAPALGLGQFDALRSANVSVFGTLLSVGNSINSSDLWKIPLMQSMVEGTSPGSDAVCGEVPVPQSYSNGAFIQATDTTQLSRVFLGLSESIGGGAYAEIDAEGHFQVDPGVAGFSLISADGGTWSLTPPGSSEPLVSNDHSSEDALSVTTSAGALLIKWPTTGKAPDSGQWTFVSSEDPYPELLRFSGLSIELDSLSSIVAQSPTSIAGTIMRPSGEPLGLHNYNYSLTLFKRVAGSASLTEIATVDADVNSGEFAYEYTDLGPEGKYDIVASVTGLTTTTTALGLEDFSTSFPVTVEVPENFPTIGAQPIMSGLVGSSGESTGQFTIEAPADGSAGQACFTEAPIPDDSPDADRASTWATSWSIAGAEIEFPSCIEIEAGSTNTVDVALSNSTPANSTVRATLTIAMKSTQDTTLNQSVELTAVSTQPVNAAILWWMIVLLILLGILLPLGLLYFVNYVSAKIGYGAKLQRASFPVTVSPDGTISSRNGANLRGADVGTDDFKFQAPREDARSFLDADLGTLKAMSPVNPFGEVAYVVTPAAGRVVFVLGKTGTRPSKRGFLTGRKATFNGHMSDLAAVVVSETEHVAKGGGSAINGTLVVYAKSPGAGHNGYSARMAEVLSASKLRAAMANSREAIRIEQAAEQPKGRSASTVPSNAAALLQKDVPAAASKTQRDSATPPPPLKKRVSSTPTPPSPGGTGVAPRAGRSTPKAPAKGRNGTPPPQSPGGSGMPPPPPPPPPPPRRK
ncbi:hypothetical protein [Salinibacterium sp. SWN1162]|uniref:hypothetical protein n=1 Tax=Salinibacterium sp. SWN1162 TaxID=2792053 RepID=UPI0018CE5D1D|nr:hypothetical protein [Salinibacterium sp. SWN1162]MBH0008609.1 hypothetical protein [Salinibacterium sp. SWN1162]